MISPRIYWLGCHQTLRYEEVPMLIEAGAEVIPDIGDPNWLRYDNNYNNENHRLYPHWRISCRLPTNIVERIRDISFWENRGKVTGEEADLINQYIHVIFVSHYPDILENITKWFKGYVVYRVFGIGDYTTYTQLMKNMNIDIDNLISNDKYVWAPIRNSLHADEDPRILKNKLYINAFVSGERLRYKWKYKKSEDFISTNISYLDGNPVSREILKNFSNEFSEIPFVVLGKNSKNAAKDICDNVLGYLDDNDFYLKIAESRIFAYIGLSSNYHLHYPPIEAISMGVPVFFLEKSGLAQEARDKGISNDKLRRIGMCESIKDMRKLVIKNINNFDELKRIANNQSDVFSQIFSRKKALERTKEFFNKIQSYVLKQRKMEDTKPIYFNIVKKKTYQSNYIEEDIPTNIGEEIVFSLEKIQGFSGKLIYDHNGRFVSRRIERNLDSPGLFAANYIKKMTAGKYLFSLEIKSLEKCSDSVGMFLIGIWNPQFNILNSQEISNLKSGKNIIDLIVEVSLKEVNLLKELRIVWNGIHTIDVSRLIVKKLA